MTLTIVTHIYLHKVIPIMQIIYPLSSIIHLQSFPFNISSISTI